MNPFIAKDDGKYVLFSITFAVVPYVGTWIEMFHESYDVLGIDCRSLRGNVDRNKESVKDLSVDWVVPYVGTWIEILMNTGIYLIAVVVPYVGTWIEIHLLASRISIKT